MGQRLFVFVQMEFPSVLGPPDGRYLIRGEREADPERVIVLETLSSTVETRTPGRGLLGRRAPSPAVDPEPEPTPVPTTRATVIDPVSLTAEVQARRWLSDLDPGADVMAAAAVVNRVLHFQRLAAADPYVHEVSPAQALVIRAGWGEGEQVAYGRWSHARELRSPGAAGSTRFGGRRARTAALRPQERLAALLGARSDGLLCEELALRTRLDIDHGRIDLAAVQLDRALAAASAELRAEGRQDLLVRIAELEQLATGVGAQASSAITSAAPVDGELIEHALGRLEAALRARTASGFNVS